MITRDEDIIEKILMYVKEDRYRQAILIDGEWGTGKTFFIKEKLLEELINKVLDKEIYYISLYGVSSSEQIMDEIYSAMIEKIVEKRVGKRNFAKRKDVIEKGILCTAKIFTTGLKYLNVDSKDLPKLSDIKDLKKAIIIFDDLERCQLEINQTLGLINNLVEHNDIKVIIVANQNEIGKISFKKDLSNKFQTVLNDRVELKEKGSEIDSRVCYTKEQLIKRAEELFREDNFYKEVKEKLIGLTIYYQPDFAKIFVPVVGKYIKVENTKKYLISNKQKIVNIFEDIKHYNIRTLIFAIIAFEKFHNIISDIQYEIQEYINQEIEKVMKYTMFSAIKIKSGESSFSWEDRTSKSGLMYYNTKNVAENRIFAYRFVDEYLLYCNMDKKYIEDTILENVKIQKMENDERVIENTLHYGKLYTWWELEDEEVEEVVSEICRELEEQKYEPRYFKDIVVAFMQIQDNGFECFNYSAIIGAMKLKLEQYEGKFERNSLEVLSENQEFIRQYNRHVEPLFELLDRKRREEKIENNAFLCDHKCWNESFVKQCEEQRGEYITDKAFFVYIDPEKFISELQEAKVIEISNFIRGIKRVYNFSNVNDFFKTDIPNLIKILGKIDVAEMSLGKKTRTMVLDRLNSTLEEVLKNIEKPIYKK